MRGSLPRKRAFTLVELLVVLAIVAVAAGLLLSAVQAARAAAARAACSNGLRQLALAVHGYDAAQRELPQGCSLPPGSPEPGYSGSLSFNWLMSLLPQVEQEAVFAAIDAGKRIPYPHYRDINEAMRGVVIKAYLCPAAGMSLTEERDPARVGFGLTHYLGSAGSMLHFDDGVFGFGLSVRMDDITDGTSNTLMIGERPPGPRGEASAWYLGEGASLNPYSTLLASDDDRYNSVQQGCPGPDAPGAGPLRPGRLTDSCDRSHFWSLHPGGANFAFADGSVRFLKYAASPMLPALATRAGGEPVRLD